MKKTVFLYFVGLLIFSPLYAEIITDGSLGTPINLAGPNFQIEAGLGQQRGGNLFHSFQEFNLKNHESATFSGANTIQNVISRVTGGHASQIDGLLRSTIPDADIYFLNPYGLMFGPNARLDVSGSFHASTADYLRLGKARVGCADSRKRIFKSDSVNALRSSAHPTRTVVPKSQKHSLRH
jgi:filamentous hemagglutinin family protein